MARRVILLVGVLVLGLYVIPQATAKYAGSHTWERNDTYGVYGLRCTRCHYYILAEMSATNLSDDVAQRHRIASENTAYIGFDNPINISRDGLPIVGASMVNVCLMCHVAEADSLAINGIHTKIVIRVCTDLDCHGDQSGTTSGSIGAFSESTTNVTGRINQTTDAHSNFYRPLSQRNSTIYRNEDGGFYDEGFIACMGCHTHVGLDLEFKRPNKFSLNMTFNNTGGVPDWRLSGQGLTVNFSSTNISISTKSPGTVWE